MSRMWAYSMICIACVLCISIFFRNRSQGVNVDYGPNNEGKG